MAGVDLPGSEPGCFDLSAEQVAFVFDFGFLHLPRLLDDRIAKITAAFEELMDRSSNHTGEKRTSLMPFLNKHPYLVSLLDDPRIDGIARGLCGDDYQYWNSDGNYYTGSTGWHSDFDWSTADPRVLPADRFCFVKLAIYLDPLTRDTGALRVIPGSHLYGDSFADNLDWRLRGRAQFWRAGRGDHADRAEDQLDGTAVPAIALETEPGDVVLFPGVTKHASFGGGARRRMFTINYTRRVTTATDAAFYAETIKAHAFTSDIVFGGASRSMLTGPPRRQAHLAQLKGFLPTRASL